jgi:hypothetical protein
MRRATMAASDLSTFYRPRKGKYRRRTDGPIAKSLKGSIGSDGMKFAKGKP